MVKHETVTIKKEYMCSYHCHKCGELNIETGEVVAEGSKSLRYTSVDEARELATQLALKRRDIFYKNLRDGVNSRQFYDVLRVSGVCKKCGAQQVWKVRPSYKGWFEALLFIIVLLFVPLGVLLVILMSLEAIMAGVVMPGVVFILLSLLLGRILFELPFKIADLRSKYWRKRVRKKVDGELMQLTDRDYYPYVMAGDDAVNEDDPRSVELARILKQAQQDQE